MAPGQRKTRAISRRKRAVLIGMGLVGAAVLIGLDRGVVTPWHSNASSAGSPTFEADLAHYHGRSLRVARVVDGDTLYLAAPDGTQPSTKVRLLGIDAPEMASDGAAAMYYAQEAAKCAERLTQGKSVTIYLDDRAGSRGRYGRLLAYIELPDGTILNEQLLLEGCAYADLRFPHSYYHKYRQLESSARVLNEGFWAHVTPEQMPTWRGRPNAD